MRRLLGSGRFQDFLNLAGDRFMSLSRSRCGNLKCDRTELLVIALGMGAKKGCKLPGGCHSNNGSHFESGFQSVVKRNRGWFCLGSRLIGYLFQVGSVQVSPYRCWPRILTRLSLSSPILRCREDGKLGSQGLRLDHLETVVIDALAVLGRHPAIIDSTLESASSQKSPESKKREARLLDVVDRLKEIQGELERLDAIIMDKKRPTLGARMRDKAESLLVEEKRLKNELKILELTLQHD